MKKYVVTKLTAVLLTVYMGCGMVWIVNAASAAASAEEDKKAVAALDIRYQAAVKANDAATMNRIFHEDFTLVTGKGVVSNKADWIKRAENKTIIYERQEHVEGTQTVRVFGNTAIVTALLWIKGTIAQEGKRIDVKLWYSDTYIRTPQGWLYVFGQSSIPLPEVESKQ